MRDEIKERLDKLIESSIDLDISVFTRKFKWKETVAIRSRKCAISKKKIPMLTKAYKGVRGISGPGSPVYITKWVCKEEFIFHKIRGNL